MRLKSFIPGLAVLFCIISLNTNAQTGCCPSPDSLMVTSVTDSSFCVKWKIKDTIGCDTPKLGQLQYRAVGAAVWTRVNVTYSGSATYAVKCDTATSCTKYQWRVRNLCIHGDTTYTNWITGQRFATKCDTSIFRKNINVKIIPNPAADNILLEGINLSMSKAKVTISSMSGNIRYQQLHLVTGEHLRLPINISNWEDGVYFVTISDGKENYRYSFIKQ
ncbi:T9SS type A sorting domain-containing protein [Panacibacter sp. DH6]|uniref:T9SS type A sorting domain-containing protein n=1 Tax=Panacibacter microcysteis TaxID=2793269 RepID=A0A931E657_9BACT|nr:T9SS type A sorting domain-containing protein [Panacibacter microcysteis]MBG9375874.1 T9SS type A sorting domain-containing protein [Panacibacter microcysteis]